MSTEPINFTESFLKALRDGQMPKRYYADTKAPGHVVRRLPTGTVAFYFRYRKGGKQVEMRVGIWGKKVTLEQARTKSKKLLWEVADGRDPAGEKSAAGKQAIDAKTNTLSHVIDLHVEAHVKKLRTAKPVTSALEQVKAKIGHLWIRDVKRLVIAELLREIAAERGHIASDRTKAYLRACFNWWTESDDEFEVPIVRGMRRSSAVESERTRKLDHDEIRDVCAALESADLPDAYRRCVRMLLLTGLRRDDVADATWAEVKGSQWKVQGGRHKSKKDHLVPVTDEVRRLLGPPRKSGYCFSTLPDASKPIQGFGKWKIKLDAEIAAMRKKRKRKEMPDWELGRDIRRTQMTMMMDLKIPHFIGDRVQGRTFKGATVTYDRSDYEEQKTDALQRVAAKLEEILSER